VSSFSVRIIKLSKPPPATFFHIQAEKKESAAHLFYHDPERTAIHYKDDSFIVGDKTLGLSALLDLIDKYPEKFSPDVLTRPVWQSYLFPVVGQAGGPSEIAYFAQIGRLFEFFGLSQPYIFSRPSATLIEKHQEKLMKNLEIDFDSLGDDTENIINRILAGTFPEEIESSLLGFKDKLKSEYDKLTTLVLGDFKDLQPMTGQTYGRIEQAIGNLEKKIRASHKRKNDITRQQIYRLSSFLFPNRNPQERIINIIYYISKYGFGIIDYIIDNFDVTKEEHQLINLSGQ
jgi:uncharacterized protein YllA (UPF0747 family)